ncbi:B3 domain-containing transcription repressor VAL2 [Bienertia sinuspersici]
MVHTSPFISKFYLTKVSSIGSSSSGSSPKDCFLLEDSCKFHDSVAGELLADPGRLKPLNDEMQERDKASHEGYLKQSQLTKSGRIFLFEKKLTPSDCDLRVGRLLLPKLHAEKLIHQPPAQRKKLVVINDTEGGFWNFTMRWWPNKRSRKYVLDGARQCREKMQWNVGDILKFYRQLSDGKMIMELQKGCECTSSVIPVGMLP